ncbi:MAG: flagellin [Oscillospiraceae bacterium]|nr:flagellin [Oscillospiraceae bacterium]
MRIQHNIPAMNSYRNYSNNVSKVAKNLEKLSTGYKINRAGDDAAGLAISEKMRIQITGLAKAQDNAKAGINLVQTAEGALTEVHDMLNRMYDLAEQSANGTYDDTTDRKQLQKEVNSLREEIDRIADATNYNGIKLLDGSLSAEGTTKGGGSLGVNVSAGVEVMNNITTISATKGKVVSGTFFDDQNTAGTLDMVAGDKLTFTLNYTDTNGLSQTKEINFKIGEASDGTAGKGLYLDDGSEDGVYLIDLNAANKVVNTELATALQTAFKKDGDLNAAFTVTNIDQDGTAKGITLESRKAGTDGAKVNSMSIDFRKKGSTNVQAENHWDVSLASSQTAKTAGVVAEDEKSAYDLSKSLIFDLNAADASTTSTKRLEDAVIDINGEKFVFIQSGKEKDVDVMQALRDAGIDHWIEVATDDTVAAGDVTKMADKMAAATGLQVVQGTSAVDNTTGAISFTAGNTGTKVIFRDPGATGKHEGSGGLRMQIGDTAEDFNMLTVSVNDMHTAAMKYTAAADATGYMKAADGMTLADVDISNQEDASKAMAVIKNATNYVSDVRGGLGALQNRLDHTINSLSVAQENIQDAEATIRDVDVAKEMMAYTKNNILVQSAQAMLAQANQLPQGVLQLLG